MDAKEFTRKMNKADSPAEVERVVDEATKQNGHQGTARLIHETAHLVKPVVD